MLVEKKRKALTLIDPDMGRFVIQPSCIDETSSEQVKYVFCPSRIKEQEVDVIIDWLALSSAQILCHKEDIKIFAEEGIQTHRFHEIGSFQSLELSGGAVEFFPTKEQGQSFSFLRSFFSRNSRQSYHIFLRPNNQHPILYLGSPKISDIDWQYFQSKEPLIIGNPQYPRGFWDELSTKLGVDIEIAEYKYQFESKEFLKCPKEKMNQPEVAPMAESVNVSENIF